MIVALTIRQLRTADAALIAQAAGFDAIIVDREHGGMSEETAAMLCTSALGAEIMPLVRTADQSAHAISGALDGGAQGVIVPHVESAAEARAIAAHAKYPPLGHRSVMALSARTRYRGGPLAKVLPEQNAQTLVVAMLETQGAVARADEIAAVEGVDALMIGPTDLAAEMGLPGEASHARVREAQARVAGVCRAHGKRFAIVTPGDDRAYLAELVALGASFLMAGIDAGYLLQAAKRDVEAIRAAK